MKGNDYLAGIRSSVAEYTPHPDTANLLREYEGLAKDMYEPKDVVALGATLHADDIKDIIAWGPEYVGEIAWFHGTYGRTTLSMNGVLGMANMWVRWHKGVHPNMIRWLNDKIMELDANGGSIAPQQGAEINRLIDLCAERERAFANRKHTYKQTPIQPNRPATFGSWS